MQEIKIGGIYRHSKGNLYRVLNVAKSSETLEQVLVRGVWTPRFQWIKDESIEKREQ